MAGKPIRALGIIAACWALPYVISKVQFAIEERLGVHGGPHVTPADYAGYDGPAAVSAAQWGNAAAGAAILLISLLPATAIARRLNRWVVAIPLLAAGALQAAAAALLAVGALSGRGGGLFCAYVLAWASILVVLAVGCLTTRSRRTRPEPVASRS